MQVLSQEDFDYKKTLADLGASIAAARAEISTLREKKEEFIRNRESECVIHVQKVLENSQSALREITQNREELLSFASEVASYSIELKGQREKVEENIRILEENGAKILSQLKEKSKELEMLALDCRIEREKMKTDKLMLKSREIDMDRERKILRSQRLALESALKEMKVSN